MYNIDMCLNPRIALGPEKGGAMDGLTVLNNAIIGVAIAILVLGGWLIEDVFQIRASVRQWLSRRRRK
jgi:uncharacterized protein HemY